MANHLQNPTSLYGQKHWVDSYGTPWFHVFSDDKTSLETVVSIVKDEPGYEGHTILPTTFLGFKLLVWFHQGAMVE